MSFAKAFRSVIWTYICQVKPNISSKYLAKQVQSNLDNNWQYGLHYAQTENEELS